MSPLERKAELIRFLLDRAAAIDRAEAQRRLEFICAVMARFTSRFAK
jgi:hypothetical protein